MENSFVLYSDALQKLVKGDALHNEKAEASLAEITELASKIIDLERASVWMYSDDRESIYCKDLYCRSINDHSCGGILKKSDFPAYFSALNENRTIDACNAHLDPNTSEFSATYLTQLGIGAMLDAPIILGGETIGVLCLEHVGRARTWTPQEILFAGSLGDLISCSVEANKRQIAENALCESEERYQLAAILTKTGHHIWDEIENKAINCSRELAEMHGISVEEYLHRTSSFDKKLECYHPDDRERFSFVVTQARKYNVGYEVVARIIRDDGGVRHLHEIADVKLHDDGTLLQTIGATQDITDRRLVEEELRTQGQIISNMVDGAVLIKSSDKTIVYSNPSAEKMFGYKASEFKGKHVSALFVSAKSDNINNGRTFLRRLETNETWQDEILCCRKDQTQFWYSVNVSSLEHPLHGKVCVLVGSDLTQSISANEQLIYQAMHDELTGLINRYEFERRGWHLLKSIDDDSGEHALCYIDIDQFKVVNDSCGHGAGDVLLRQLGQVLSDSLRDTDTLARLGGDEFGVLLTNYSLSQAEEAVVAMQNAIQEMQFLWEDQLFQIGVSIGLVVINDSKQSFTELLKHADAACFMAKDLGRNRMHIYRPEDADISKRHGEMQWVARINRALDEDRFVLYAQKILDLKNPNNLHFEVLLRMVGEQGEIIGPGAFLPAAERYEVMHKIDDWVIENTLSLLANHSCPAEKTLMVSINLSGQSLTKQNFKNVVLDSIERFNIDPKILCFEITETAAVSRLESAREFIESLQNIGCSFALDDFGRGVSSFAYLKNLPVDYLKIDGMFVKEMDTDPIYRAMVKSINEIGQVMGMKTIAEFVETTDICKMVEEIGIDYAQGYGIAKPEEFTDILGLL